MSTRDGWLLALKSFEALQLSSRVVLDAAVLVEEENYSPMAWQLGLML